MALRWFLINTQYRQPVNYTERALLEASDRVYYVLETLQSIDTALDAAGATSRGPGPAHSVVCMDPPCCIKGAGLLRL